MYSELIIRPKALENQILFPNTARDLVGLACKDLPINPLVFNHDEAGKNIQGKFFHPDINNLEARLPKPPVVSFDGGKGFIRIYMLGEPGKALMEETAPLIAQALAKHLGGTYSFSLNEGKCTVEEAYNPMLYSIRRLVVSKKTDKYHPDFFSRPIADSEYDIPKMILRGLLSQAKWLDENGSFGLANRLPDLDTLGLHIAEGRPGLMKVKDGINAVGYTHLVFSMNLNLMGPWSAGLLRSRGEGAIRKLILGGAR